MDFVVSKVALSVAALMTASILAGVFDRYLAPDEAGELGHILDGLSERMRLIAVTGPGSSCTWAVPYLSDGDGITVEVGFRILCVRSGSDSAAIAPPVEIHTWCWEGDAVNTSELQALDLEAPVLTLASGSSMIMEVVAPPVDGYGGALLFVRSPT